MKKIRAIFRKKVSNPKHFHSQIITLKYRIRVALYVCVSSAWPIGTDKIHMYSVYILDEVLKIASILRHKTEVEFHRKLKG